MKTAECGHEQIQREFLAAQDSSVLQQWTGKMVDLALIIVNSKYKSKILNDLPKVTDEAVMMKEMLTSHDYEIELYQDVEDIGEILEKFQR